MQVLGAIGLLFCQGLSQSVLADCLQADVAAVLNADDECRALDGTTGCALELAQLRAAKVTKPSHALSKEHSKNTPKHKASYHRKKVTYDHPAWINNCKKILIDVGSNIGVNTANSTNPKKYDDAKLLPFFLKHFGEPAWRRTPAGKSGVCALGLEPNHAHDERLQAIEKAYGENNWHVHFYPYAAWSSDGKMPFNKTSTSEKFRNMGDLTNRGAHLSMEQDSSEVVSKHSMVRTVNLADFVASLPKGTVQLMLMDIEGAEYEILAQMMIDKQLCRNDVRSLLVETHDWGDISRWGNGSSFKKNTQPRSLAAIHERVKQMGDMKWCGNDNVTSVGKFDDETFPKDVDDNFGIIQR